MDQPARHCAWTHARSDEDGTVPHVAELLRKDTRDGSISIRPRSTQTPHSSAQAAAFAQLLGLLAERPRRRLAPGGCARRRTLPAPDGRRRVPPRPPPRHPRRRHGPRQDAAGDRVAATCRPRRAVSRRLPGVGEAQLGARDRGGRAGGVRSGARRRHAPCRNDVPEWTIVNYDILSKHLERARRACRGRASCSTKRTT